MKKLILLVVFLFLSSCAPSPENSIEKIHIKDVKISASELRAMFPGVKHVFASDTNYAPFNTGYLSKWQDKFEETLSDLGLTPTWRPEFDCNRFALTKMGIGQILYVSHSFHDKAPAQGIAIGEMWYDIDGDPRKGHAINIIVTLNSDGRPERRYIDIYTGKTLILNHMEIASIYMVKF